MKKSLIIIVAALMSASVAQAQFYNTASANHGGQTTIYLGMGNTNSTPVFRISDNSLWGHADVTPSSVKHIPTFAFLVTGGGLRDVTENLKLGAMAGVGYTTSSFEAEFKAASIGGAYDYIIDVKSKLIDIQLGIEGEVLPVEKIGINFAVAPYVQFLYGGKTKAEQYLAATGTLIENADANNWHEVTKGDFSMPNMDFGMLGRVGVNYHFTEMFYAGIAAQMRFPLFNTGFDDVDDIDRGLDYGFRCAESKRKGWAVMLSVGLNID